MTREEAITDIKDNIKPVVGGKSLDMAIKALEQEPILDKIRAEIEQLHLIGYATANGKREIASRAVLQILDKYKAESEEQEDGRYNRSNSYRTRKINIPRNAYI